MSLERPNFQMPSIARGIYRNHFHSCRLKLLKFIVNIQCFIFRFFSVRFLRVLLVLFGFLQFLRIPYISLWFLRIPQGSLCSLEFVGFLMILYCSLGILMFGHYGFLWFLSVIQTSFIRYGHMGLYGSFKFLGIPLGSFRFLMFFSGFQAFLWFRILAGHR